MGDDDVAVVCWRCELALLDVWSVRALNPLAVATIVSRCKCCSNDQSNEHWVNMAQAHDIAGIEHTGGIHNA